MKNKEIKKGTNIRKKMSTKTAACLIAIICSMTMAVVFDFVVPENSFSSYAAEETVTEKTEGAEPSSEQEQTSGSQDQEETKPQSEESQQQETGNQVETKSQVNINQTKEFRQAKSSAETMTDGDFKTDVLALQAVLEPYCTEGQIVLNSDNTAITAIEMVYVREAMIIISNANPELYQNAAIRFNVTGDVSTLGTVAVGDETLTYQGLGSRDVPFRGEFVNNTTIVLERPLFNGIEMGSDKTIILKWKALETCDGMFASYIEGNDRTLNISAVISKDSTGSSIINTPVLGSLLGDLELNSEFIFDDSESRSIEINSSDDSGLLVNTLLGGTLTTTVSGVDNDTVSGISIKALNGNAGLLIGRLKENIDVPAIFELNSNLSILVSNEAGIKRTITARLSAGGLVGMAEKGSSVSVNENISVVGLKVYGNIAGGFIGSAEDLNLSIAADKVITPSASVGTAEIKLKDEENVSSLYSGGLFGVYKNFSDKVIPASKFNISENTVLTAVTDEGIAGGVFGLAEIGANASISIQGRETQDKFITSIDSRASIKSYGGIAGEVTGAGASSVIRISNYEVTANNAGNAIYNAGIAGIVGNRGDNSKAATLAVQDIEIICKNPLTSNVDEYGFGGIAGRLADGSVIDADNISVKTADGEINAGGAVLGFADKGSAVRLKGTTDVSDAEYGTGNNIGQLVGGQDSALIYAMGSGSDKTADGWGYVRNIDTAYDDIGNYGQVYRVWADGLSDSLINMDSSSYAVTLSQASFSGDIDVSNEDDLARFAITLQTEGYFSGDTSTITADNWADKNSEMLSKTIKLNSDVILSGTGVTGITRDSDYGSFQAYTGSLNGNNHTIALAVGEAYGMKTMLLAGTSEVDVDDAGNGIVYRHNRLGLFNTVTGSAENLIIAGNIRFEAAVSGIAAGGYSAYKNGGDSTLSGCIFMPEITYKTENKTCYVGGVYGILNENNINKIVFSNDTKIAPIISIDAVSTNGSDITGGAIGLIDGDSPAEVNAEKMTLSATITNTDHSNSTCLAGGFIGIIQTTPTETIAIKRSKPVNVVFSDVKMDGHTVDLKTNTATGGLLGYMWADTEVSFGGNNGSYSLRVSDSTATKTTLNAETRTTGGLVYRASGKWSIGNKGISLDGATINGLSSDGVLGILVCRGAYGDENIGGLSKRAGALYLELTEQWDNAYAVENINIGCRPEFFDEFLAYSQIYNDSYDIFSNNVNGVVSLKTTGTALIMDGESINSYKNRTLYGRSHNTNANTRYYYNLDSIINEIEDGTSNNNIDTPEELLVWSLNIYAGNNIKKYFEAGDAKPESGRKTVIGGTEEIDLNGYSYYPVSVNNRNVTVNNTAIVFHNSSVENGENSQSNKTTRNKTQHYAMHCGLFRDFKSIAENKDYQGSYSIEFQNVKLRGDVGIYGDNSVGALINGTVKGFDYTGIPSKYSVKIKECTLDGIIVDGIDGDILAPLLINKTGSYSEINVDDLNTDNAKYKDASGVFIKAGSSLLGDIGNDNATHVTVNFNRVAVPSLDSNSIFTKASLLNSFSYKKDTGIGSGTYNFTKADKETGKVTFGEEIDGSVEYKDLQLWFYDKDTYKSEDGLTTDGNIKADADNPTFGIYLPYVNVYDINGSKHEIKVNQRIADIIEGCGTYGDPYVITEPIQLETIAGYINKGSVGAGLKITLAADPGEMCRRLAVTAGEEEDTSNHATYVSSGDTWISGNNVLNNETVHRYMQSAYYDIQADISMTDFAGIGNFQYPFRGVICSTNNRTITLIQENKSLQGFIPYSYGTVIKDISIVYQGRNQIVYQGMSDPDLSPYTFFGGAIGLIQGGDNIIDNVKVTAQSGGDSDFSISYSDLDKKHLVPTGGYIGAISGGGVIFRNMQNSTEYSGLKDDWLDSSMAGMSSVENATKSLYVNPIIGRVISGFAFTEGCSINNTNKNYPINKLIPEGDNKGITSTNVGSVKPVKTMINSAQGLMVLSAIITSGAGAGHINEDPGSNATNLNGTNPYYGRNEEPEGQYAFGNGGFGKVRNASYEYVGKPDNDKASADFNVSVMDDTRAPGLSDRTYSIGEFTGSDKFNSINNNPNLNSPYLVKNYATPETEFVCASHISLMKLIFKKDAVFDMSQYGNAYVGLTGRFKSNTVGSNQTTSASLDRVIPYLICIEGNGATIKVSTHIKEYTDDDYNTPGVGGLFATAFCYYNSSDAQKELKDNDYCMVRNLTIEGTDEGNGLSLKYYGSDGTEKTSPDNSTIKELANVGGIAGNMTFLTGTGNLNIFSTAIMKNVSVRNIDINAPYAAGSISGGFATSGKSTINHTIGRSSSNKLSYHLINCSYSGNNISALQYAGGLIGIGKSSSELNNGITVTSEVAENFTVGKNSTVRTTGSSDRAGGIVAEQEENLVVNDQDYKVSFFNGSGLYSNEGRTLKRAIIEDVSIETNRGITGGFVGQVSKNARIYNAEVVSKDTNVILKGNGIGGAVGRFAVNGSREAVIQGCRIYNIQFKSSEKNVGGLVGSIEVGSAASDSLVIADCSVKNSVFSGADANAVFNSGGAIGNIADSIISIKIRNFEACFNSFVGKKSAGLIGISNGDISGCNILLADNDVNNSGQALVAGSFSQTTNKMHLAGVSIRLKENQTDIPLYGEGENYAESRAYIAFADYTNSSADGIINEEKNKNVLGTERTAPYVTTSPVIDYTVKSAESGAEEYLFGDSIGTVDSNGEPLTTAKTISDETDSDNNTTRYKYSKAAGIEFDYNTQISTFNKNNESAVMKADTDIPVIRVAGGDTAYIEKYLNIVTNGGYSDAKKFNETTDDSTSHVSAEIAVYEWDGSESAFVRTANVKPSIIINRNGTQGMNFQATTEYDNDRGRFSLLTVKFKEAGSEYRVSVPIIVRRVLEVNFTATMNYGTVFKKNEYGGLGNNAHILESFGNPVTALLTFKYNSAYKEATEYGWDSYLAAGGEMKAIDKRIVFDNSSGDGIPAGTMLSLIDCVDNKVYTATYNGGKSISLSAFKDTSGNSYKNRWISELMGVKASSASDGIWVKCSAADAGDAAAMDKNGDRYRLAGENDDGETKYNLTVDKDGGREIQPEESFYLVINVPYNDDTKNLSANGYIGAQLISGTIPNNVNCTLRTDSGRDSHQNTASTYSFLSGYKQALHDISADKDQAINDKMKPVQEEGVAGRFINMDVVDEISFNSGQNYNETDELYYRLESNLHQYENNELSTTSGFATGTEGVADFYVYTGSGDNKTYYKYENGNWVNAESRIPAVSYDWESNASNKGAMSLVLATESGEPISLNGIRTICKRNNISTFCIETAMRLHLSDAAVKVSIQGSTKAGVDNFTKLYYKGTLAVRKESLSYSNTTDKLTGLVGYYRGESGASRISYSANDIKQLGINCSDLDSADGNITTTGVYSLEDVVNANDKILIADRIVYTLKLERRTGKNGAYTRVDDPENYISVRCDQLGNGIKGTDSFSWTDTKSNGEFSTNNGSKRFTVTIQVKVETDNVEDLTHFYSNYRLRLTAEMYDGNDRIDYPVNDRIAGGETVPDELSAHSDYVTYTLTKINIDGIVRQN